MPKKIEIIEQALVVTNTDTSEVLFDVPKSHYYYDTRKLNDESFILFYNIDYWDNLMESLQQIKLSDAVDSTLTPFTKSSFENFCRQNLI